MKNVLRPERVITDRVSDMRIEGSRFSEDLGRFHSDRLTLFTTKPQLATPSLTIEEWFEIREDARRKGQRLALILEAHLTTSAPRLRPERTGYPAGWSATISRRALIDSSPVSACVSAAGIRFLVILLPPLAIGISSRSAHQPRSRRPGLDPGGVSTFHTHKTRPGWAALISPETGGAQSRPATITGVHLASASQRRVLHRATTIHPCAAPLDEPSTRVQAIRPSDLPLTRDRWMDHQPFGFPPELRTPRLLATHVGAGTDLSSTSPNQRLRHQPNLQPRRFTSCVRPRVALV
jgi:hypothetical protein